MPKIRTLQPKIITIDGRLHASVVFGPWENETEAEQASCAMASAVRDSLERSVGKTPSSILYADIKNIRKPN
jgi:hypothetical protein